MEIKYREPPIVEALCEFRFDSDSSWDITIPGLMFKKLQDEFPNKGKGQLFGIDISAGPDSISQKAEKIELAQFKHHSKPLLIQVGPNLLTINHLAPYSSWEELLPYIENTFKIYQDTANPRILTRIGLRYINKIDIPKDQFKFSLFEFRPNFWSPSPDPESVRSFIIGAEIPQENQRDMLRIQLTTASPSRKDHKSFLLDIDYFIDGKQSVQFEDAIGWVNDAHHQVEEAFEHSITDELRLRFDGKGG